MRQTVWLTPFDDFEEANWITENTPIADEKSIERDEDISPEAERINEQRIILLAKKYTQNLSREHSARLSIVTEQVRKLIPSVTPEDYDQLKEIVLGIKQTLEEVERIRREYELD